MNKILIVFCCLLFSACTTASKAINPFYEKPSETALLGQVNDHALNPTKNKVGTARQSLQALGQYQQAHTPQPYNPVYKPAMIRLMWVPDHLNRHGDLVPAHYYYLKVKDGDWAVKDAFELEKQLGGKNDTSNVPFRRR